MVTCTSGPACTQLWALIWILCTHQLEYLPQPLTPTGSYTCQAH